MLDSVRDNWLRAFYVDGEIGKRVPAELERQLFRKLQLVDDATTDSDLRVPPGNHFEKLSGNLVGWHSIRINQRWRLVFRWDGATGKATDVCLDDHSYR